MTYSLEKCIDLFLHTYKSLSLILLKTTPDLLNLFYFLIFEGYTDAKRGMYSLYKFIFH
jgi:hypothetical protein